MKPREVISYTLTLLAPGKDGCRLQHLDGRGRFGSVEAFTVIVSFQWIQSEHGRPILALTRFERVRSVRGSSLPPRSLNSPRRNTDNYSGVNTFFGTEFPSEPRSITAVSMKKSFVVPGCRLQLRLLSYSRLSIGSSVLALQLRNCLEMTSILREHSLVSQASELDLRRAGTLQ